MIKSELVTLSRLSVPIIVTQLAQMGIGVVDTMMAGHVSAVDLAGVALGGNLYWPVMFFLSGIVMSVTPSVSQLNGAGQSQHVGAIVRQVLWIVLFGGFLALLLLQNIEPVYYWLGVDPAAIPVAVAYLDAVSWGLIPILGYFALRYVCDGMSWTRPAMVIALCALALKVPVNYLFIYGGWGIKPMGGAGCGMASTIVMSTEFTVMALVVSFGRIKNLEILSHFSWPDWQEIWRLFSLGLPIGISIFLEMAVFSAVSLMIGRLGVTSVAAHQIAMNVGGLTFMVPLAIGMAATIRVGFNVGARNYAMARISGWVALGASLTVALFAMVLVYTFRGDIARLYTTDTEVIRIASTLIVFVCIYQVFDNTQVTVSGALRGYKDTRAPMYIGLIAYWLICFPLGVILGFGLEIAGFSVQAQGVSGFWWALVVGLLIAAVALSGRFLWISRDADKIQLLAAR
ncbi:MAG: MATE family efflux transporter [Pseudomonadales bacterium]|nr:MATE family efflux transporter [Pseudomonadales bacterium]